MFHAIARGRSPRTPPARSQTTIPSNHQTDVFSLRPLMYFLGGLDTLTRTVAAEMGLLGIPGITVNAICPDVVNTDMILGDGGVVDEIARILRISRDQVLQERILPM